MPDGMHGTPISGGSISGAGISGGSRDWHNSGNYIEPSAEFIFDGRELPSDLTFSRASGATRINHRGYLEEVAADVLRYTYDPALAYNLAPNPWFDGAVVAGSAPTGAGITGNTGLTLTTAGLGVLSDGRPYVDLRVAGTPGSTTNAFVNLISPSATPSVPASVGNQFSAGWGTQLVSFAQAGNATIRAGLYGMTATDFSGDFTAGSLPLVPGTSLQEVAVTRTMSSGTTIGAGIGYQLQLLTAGSAIDLVIRVAFPTLALGATLISNQVSIATLAARVGTTPQYGLLGALVERIGATNLFLNSAVGVTQNVTTTAVQHTLSFTGTGSITLTGTSTAGPLVGTGASNRVSLVFTPSAGTLTLTIAGDVRMVQLETGVLSSYIVTAGVAGIRAADIPNIDPALIDLDVSSIALRFRAERGGVGVAAPNFEHVFSARNATGTNLFRVLTNSGQTLIQARASRNGSSPGSMANSPSGSGVFQTVAAAWGPTDGVASWQGAAVGAAQPSPIGPATTMRFGSLNDAEPSNNTFQYLRIWKGRRLTAAQVQAQSARIT